MKVRALCVQCSGAIARAKVQRHTALHCTPAVPLDVYPKNAAECSALVDCLQVFCIAAIAGDEPARFATAARHRPHSRGWPRRLISRPARGFARLIGAAQCN